MLDQLFWETVCKLQTISKLTIVAAVCDGAGCNRLFQKIQTSNLKRGLKNNTFDRAWCHNKASDDLEARVYFMSDPSHLIKKYCNHIEKSFESSSRRLRLPYVFGAASIAEPRAVRTCGRFQHRRGVLHASLWQVV